MHILETILELEELRDYTARYTRLRRLGKRLADHTWTTGLLKAFRHVGLVSEPAGRLNYSHSYENATTTSGKSHVSIISANLWHDFPRYRQVENRLETFARLVETHQADVLLLQEVFRSKRLHADEWLSARLKMNYMYARANGHRRGIHFEEGLAIFSRYPMEGPALRQLSSPANPFARRLALAAVVNTPQGEILAVSTHLALGRNANKRQLSLLHTWVDMQAGARPALVGGDFNAHESALHLRRASQTWIDTFRFIHPHRDGATHSLRLPGGIQLRHRLDYIFLRNAPQVTPHSLPSWQVTSAEHLSHPDLPHSDHQAVLTRLAAEPNSG